MEFASIIVSLAVALGGSENQTTYTIDSLGDAISATQTDRVYSALETVYNDATSYHDDGSVNPLARTTTCYEYVTPFNCDAGQFADLGCYQEWSAANDYFNENCILACNQNDPCRWILMRRNTQNPGQNCDEYWFTGVTSQFATSCKSNLVVCYPLSESLACSNFVCDSCCPGMPEA